VLLVDLGGDPDGRHGFSSDRRALIETQGLEYVLPSLAWLATCLRRSLQLDSEIESRLIHDLVDDLAPKLT
jgi:hypothetical protein